jgi:predicted exporter
VFERLYGLAYEFTLRRWRAASALVLALCALAAFGLFFHVEYDGDVLLMLPEERDITRSIEYFRSADASGKVVISLGLGDDAHTRAELLASVDSLASGLDSEIFSHVMTGIDESGASKGMDSVFAALPFLLSGEELNDLVAPRLGSDEIRARLRAGYLSMFRPGGVMAGRMIMEDPLGLRAIALQKLSRLSASMGFDVRVKDGHLMSAGASHALLIASTDIQATDTIGSRKLVDSLNASLAALPGYITAEVVSGHLHTVSNEETIKSDIRLTLAIATVGFVLLFVVFLGDAGSVLVFTVPAMAVLMAANASYMLLGSLSYSVIGLAAVVAGISVDYSIHVYIGARKRGEAGAFPPGEGTDPVRVMARPITYGALTTAGMFASFFISGIRGYHQMAVFSIISVLCSLAMALLVLPHVLGRWGRGPALKIGRLGWMERLRAPGRAAFGAWLVLTLFMGYLAMGVGFDPDIRAIDGTSGEILASEDRFFDTWGQSRLAVLVGRTPDLESARELQDSLVYDDGALKGLDMEGVSSLASLWPSTGRMRLNAASWEAFWSPGRVEALREALRREGAPFGYSRDAFEPFLGSLSGHRLPEGLPEISMTERYIRELPSGGGWQVSVFFPDEPENTRAVKERFSERDDVYVVSGGALGQTISGAVTSDMKKMTLMAGIAIAALTVFFLRRPARVAGALVPVVTSTLWLAGGVSALGLKLNVANLIAFIVVMGLCVDYGIFMAHRSGRPEEERHGSGTVLAVTLSALSSLIGAGVLIFADHPALFSIGVTLVIGLGSGYLSSVLVSPWVAGLPAGRRERP